MATLLRVLAAGLLLTTFPLLAGAQVAGRAGPEMLRIVADGRPLASVVVAAGAGDGEKQAGADLVKYVEMMTGARLPLVEAATTGPAILVGRAALAEDPTLLERLAAVAKQKPFSNADAIVMRRTGERLYLAGNNDQANYFAVSRLLQDWGCRWYLPTEFGEVIPEHRELAVGSLDFAYGPPFELRSYWVAWRGEQAGHAEFQRRNFGSMGGLPGAGHALGQYTRTLVPPGRSIFHVPLADPATAQHVAAQIEADYARGVPTISLSLEDGIYRSDFPADVALQAGIFDKYLLATSQTDAMLALYNNVSRILRDKYPASPTRLGGLAYFNTTLPPQQVLRIEPNIVLWLAPIDIDPNHAIDDPDSPPRQEYGAMMYRWAQLLEGRLAIYDYDQAQMVWRDIPNPSHHVFAQDVQHYRKAGILGFTTESRGATATVFLNLFFRMQLMWDPDVDVDGLLADFYPKFFGPAAAPMADYWNAIYAAWKETLVTEHEHYIAPAIYTPELVARLRGHLARGVQATAPLQAKPELTRNERLYLERMRFMELSFAVLENYMAMVRLSATDADYAAAAEAGERALEARELLTEMNSTFTTYRRMGEKGHPWLPAEVAQMRELAAATDGTRGTLVTRLPLQWAFRRDPNDTGLPRGWAYTPADLSYWQASGRQLATADRKDYPRYWEMVRTDLYFQAQGVRDPDAQSYTGFYWYQTDLELTGEQAAGDLELRFPGAFNELWLYVNGVLVAHRPFREPWWRSHSRFDWKVNVAGRLRPGRNLITLRGFNPHHFGGLFRRPVLYRNTGR